MSSLTYLNLTNLNSIANSTSQNQYILHHYYGRYAFPIQIHSLFPDLLAAFCCVLQECMLVNSVDSIKKEVVAIAISDLNQCPFCKENHLQRLPEVNQKKIRQKLNCSNSNNHDRSLLNWALATTSLSNNILKHPPFKRQETAQILGTVLIFHYINRIINVLAKVTHKKLPSRFILNPYHFLLLKIKKKLGFPKPGEIVKCLPEKTGNLPKEFQWAKDSYYITQALGYFTEIIENIISEYLTRDSRLFIHQFIQKWQGEETKLSRSWTEKIIQNFDNKQKPIIRLALLTSLASYQVDEAVINEVYQQDHDEKKLLAIVTWSSFMTSKRIVSWLPTPHD